MSKSDLTILTVVENDCGIFDLLISSIYKFTDPVPNIIVCNHGNNGNVLSKYVNDPNMIIVDHTPTMGGGSNRHGEGLNKIFPLVDTKKTAIIESDCILLRKHWDYVDFPQHRMIAAKKGELAGAPYYHICFMVFSTAIMKHGGIIDFRPGQDGNRANRPYKPHEDVGWRIRDKVRPDEVGLMEFKDCKTGAGLYFDSRFQSDELWIGTQPTVAHFGRGSNIGGKAIRKGFKHPKDQLIEWKKIAEDIIR
jgi:hypothetical protein